MKLLSVVCITSVEGDYHASVCQTEVKVASHTERQKGRERDLMNVIASADRLPPERLLVAIETPGEEIKKGRE